MVDFTRLAHTSSKEISCCFFTLTIRRAALKEKYKGGLPAFMEKYHARTNRHLVIMCEMSGAYLDEPFEDIIENGLKYQEDFLWFEAMDLFGSVADGQYKAELGLDKPFNVGESDWLRGYYKDGKMIVSYVGR